MDNDNDQSMDTDGNLMDTDGNLMDTDGNLMDTDVNLMDTDGNLMDTDVNLMDTDGNLMDNGNLMDTDGNLMVDNDFDKAPSPSLELETENCSELEQPMKLEEENITKHHKKKAMTSEKASQKKKDGHNNEDVFAMMLVNGEVKSGTGKTDVQTNDGHTFSNKMDCKRIQFSLYSKNSKNWSNALSSEICKEILEMYPEDYEQYCKDKPIYKEKLRDIMIKLKDCLLNPEELKEYLIKMIFNDQEVEFLVLKDKEIQYIYHREDVMDILIHNVSVQNSKGEQKVVIKCENKKNILNNLFEIEVRNSSVHHYAQMLCVCNRDKLFYILNNSIQNTLKIKDNIMLNGKAIEILQDKMK